ncbi:Cytosolic carboxypeptidase 1, variant 2 [Chamberlinius hualienensis]
MNTKLVKQLKLPSPHFAEVPKKIQDGLVLLVKILKTSKDAETIKNVVQIINNQLSFRQSYRATVTTLVNCDVITALLESLFVVNAAHDKENLLLLDIHALIANIATKDPDFGLKVRKTDSMKLTIPLMKSCSEKLLQLRPLLLVLKLATADCSCTSYYGKLGVLPQLLNLINSLGRNQSTSLKLVLEILAQLTKSKFNSREVVAQSGIRLLFNQLETWEKVDGINKLKILRAILICLNNLAELKVGRSAIYDVEGLGILYRFCHGLPLLSDYDSIISLATNVAHRCLPPKWLPIDNTIGIVTFKLPSTIPLNRNLQSDSSSYEDDDNEDILTSSDDECNTPSLVSRSKLLSSMGELSTSEKVFYSAFLPELELLNGATDRCSRRIHHKEISTSNRRSSSPLRACDSFSSEKLQDALHGINVNKKDKDLTTVTSQPSSKRGSFDGELKQVAAGNEAGSCPVIFHIPAIANAFIFDEKKRIDAFAKEFKFAEVLRKNVSVTRHTAPFIKIAHPELNADKYSPNLEILHQKDFPLCREMLLQNLDGLFGGVTSKKVVYDYEALVNSMDMTYVYDSLMNEDQQRLGKSDDKSGVLHFESRFECGNLRKAIMLGPHEYELILNPDINSDHHHQWFYFEVSNMEAGIPYSFYITNCEKNNSQFNFGMKPLVYSVREASLGRAYWVRSGHDVCYYRNYYSCPPGAKGSTYFTTYFTISFQHPNDVCYVAYHYPYSHSLLQTHLNEWENCHDKNSVFFKRQTLCQTLGGNDVPILTITSNSSNLAKRPVIFLTSRVHPGETNASFVMKGTIDFLLSDRPSAESVRENFIFKIIPMLNPDGVINGSHRCSLSGADLNRCWKNPDKDLQPTIYHAKRFIQYLNTIGRLPFVYCDYHGHSRRKNIFVYGCNSKLSWFPEDRLNDDNQSEILPKLLYQLAPAFSLSNCCFTVEQNRETTARVTLWREFGIKFSYTMESSYCGCDQGPYKDHHLGIPQLREMGMKLCQSILHLYAKTKGANNKEIAIAKVKRDEIKNNNNNESTDEGEFDDDELETT